MTEPHIAQRSPFVANVSAGTYAWCACGRSKNQPYCDGSHAGTPFRPIVEKLSEARTVAWCGCKHSQNKPFCDGSHARLPRT
jgi:CDGSH-type Zn-finger protein